MREYIVLAGVYRRKKEREYEEKKDTYEAMIDFGYRLISQHASWVTAPHLKKNDRVNALDLYDPDKIKKKMEEQEKEEKRKEELSNMNEEQKKEKFDGMMDDMLEAFEL